MSLSEDPRWRRFNDRAFECPCCGKSFEGVYDIAFDHPDPWPHGSRDASGKAVLVADQDRLTSDLCNLQGQGFIRCILPMPIIGARENFAFGVWGSASPDAFARYEKAFFSDDYSDFEGCFSWLANTLPIVGTSDHVPCNLWVRDTGQRPELWAQEGDNPVYQAQQTGITFDQLLDIYAATGNDIRPHLADA